MSDINDRLGKVVEACRNASAAFDPNLYWWDQFYNAAGGAAFFVIVMSFVIGLFYALRMS